jgi:hypothetical protein
MLGFDCFFLKKNVFSPLQSKLKFSKLIFIQAHLLTDAMEARETLVSSPICLRLF